MTAPADGVWGIWDISQATEGTKLGDQVKDAIGKTLGHLEVGLVLERGWVIIENGDVASVGWIVAQDKRDFAEIPESPVDAS